MNRVPSAPNAITGAGGGQPAAWREPMLWLIVGLPLASMLFAFWLVWASVRSGGADGIGEAVHRTGEAQVADLGPDARARQLGLVAVLHADAHGIAVYPAQGGFDRGATLLLELRHPTDARQDLRLRLAAGATGWRGGNAIAGGHDWLVQLTPVDGHWRLRARLHAGSQSARLEPAVAGP